MKKQTKTITKSYTLAYCPVCNQMTNHICQKCKPKTKTIKAWLWLVGTKRFQRSITFERPTKKETTNAEKCGHQVISCEIKYQNEKSYKVR